jgi:DHA2 family multidrug resistance protein
VHQAILVSHLTPYDPAYQRWLATARSGLTTRVGALDADPKSIGLLYSVLGQQARLLAFMDIFRMVSILALLAVPLVLLFKRTPTRSAPSAH